MRDLITERMVGWEVCGEAERGSEALEIARQARPDLAIIDVSLPGIDGISLTRQLSDERLRVKVLIFTVSDLSETVTAALAAGARGYVLKSDTERSLLAAISAVGANRAYLSPEVAQVLVDLTADVRRERALTNREMQVALSIAEGAPNKVMAEKLGVSTKTIESHRCALFRKAGVRSAPELVRYLIKHGLMRA
jgi:DNA-binding NarL/FixJ family response regulator